MIGRRITNIVGAGFASVAVLWTGNTAAQPEASSGIPPAVTQEGQAAVTRGGQFLMGRQGANGAWLYSPAITGLACMALHHCEAPELRNTRQLAVEKGRKFILKNVHNQGKSETSIPIHWRHWLKNMAAKR